MAQRPTLRYLDALSAAQAGGRQPVQTDKRKLILVGGVRSDAVVSVSNVCTGCRQLG